MSRQKDAGTAEFARRLRRRMSDRGWNQSELARQATRHMPDGKKFGRDNVSNYIRAKAIPRPEHLAALAKALGCEPEDLLPARVVPSTGEKLPPFEMKATDEGMVWLVINQEVRFGLAVKIAALLEGEWSANAA